MEMTTNLSLGECLSRGIIALVIPSALLLIDSHLILYALPVIIYLYITAIIHICPIKHWTRRLKHQPDDNDNSYWDKEQ